MYPFLQLSDGTEVVHSERLPNGEMKIYVERPHEKDCFHSAECFFPEYRWKNIKGFTEEEIQKYQSVIESVLGAQINSKL